jgi:hypothetical protein
MGEKKPKKIGDIVVNRIKCRFVDEFGIIICKQDTIVWCVKTRSFCFSVTLNVFILIVEND